MTFFLLRLSAAYVLTSQACCAVLHHAKVGLHIEATLTSESHAMWADETSTLCHIFLNFGGLSQHLSTLCQLGLHKERTEYGNDDDLI